MKELFKDRFLRVALICLVAGSLTSAGWAGGKSSERYLTGSFQFGRVPTTNMLGISSTNTDEPPAIREDATLNGVNIKKVMNQIEYESPPDPFQIKLKRLH